MTPVQPNRQSGAALLMLMTIIILALTTVAVSRLSMNRLQTDRLAQDQALLNAARDAVVGFTYLKILNNATPYTLPCPDTDTPPDGQGNSNCNQSGALPYRDFQLPPQYDSGSQPVQYSVTGGPSFSCPDAQPSQVRVTLQAPFSQNLPGQTAPLSIEITAEQLCP